MLLICVYHPGHFLTNLGGKNLKFRSQLVTCKGSDGEEMTITIAGGDPWPLFRVVDSWGKTLRYDYYDETKTKQDKLDSRRNFPVITSAGADGEFNTDDDITSR